VNKSNPSQNRNLAWFTGFLPAQNPVYAFAVVYEGSPGENVSGGRVAAPIVRKVFNDIYEDAPPDDPLLLASKEPKRALLVDDDEVAQAQPARRAEPVPEAAPEPPPQTEQTGIRGLFRRLFRRE
jgi:penicillin-binding protein 2